MSLPHRVYRRDGTTLELGEEVGKGGEGVVHALRSDPGSVAKLYYPNQRADKRPKIEEMVRLGARLLTKDVAWPSAALYRSPGGGEFLGFCMPRVVNKLPIHFVYGPAHRKQKFPEMGWDYLVTVAMNLASVFQKIHALGFVVGDVNQNGVLVGRDATVSVIDCDSFQVRTPSRVFRCRVGVAHFTPPELQSVSSFGAIDRTKNHDCFGLALLIFHLLFAGRHPFAGAPITKRAGNALEEDISHFRYAYARDATTRGMSPPPRSVPISSVPQQLQVMFECAFTESGARASRPSAAQWASALKDVARSIRACPQAPSHRYPAASPVCPWCKLEESGVVLFLPKPGQVLPAGSFSLRRAWAEIESIQWPTEQTVPVHTQFAAKARPYPREAKRSVGNFFLMMTIVGGVVGMIALFPSAAFFHLLIGGGLFASAVSAGGEAHRAERSKREAAARSARIEYKAAVDATAADDERGRFTSKRKQLERLKGEYLALAQTERDELKRLKWRVAEFQKKKFLDRFFIEQADIPGIGPTRTAKLASFGIETAADVTFSAVTRVPGIGPKFASQLVSWRNACAARFRPDPRQGVPESEKNDVRAKIQRKRQKLQQDLASGSAALRELRDTYAKRRGAWIADVERAARELAQAEADLRVEV